MDNTKYTKGKWAITDGCPNGIDELKGHIRIQQQTNLMWDICAVFTDIDDNTEAKANALLISKAPEMLEMLRNIKYELEMLKKEYGLNINSYHKIEQLIKSATQI